MNTSQVSRSLKKESKENSQAGQESSPTCSRTNHHGRLRKTGVMSDQGLKQQQNSRPFAS